MKKLAIVFAFLLLGCTVGPPVTQSQLDAARSAYDGAFLAPAAHYRALPLCSAAQALPCATRANILALQAADRNVAAAFDSVQAHISSGDASTLGAAYATLQAAVKTAEDLVAQIGAK